MSEQTLPQTVFDTFSDEYSADPYPTYARLRSEGRVVWAPPGFWILPHYDEGMALLRMEHVSSDPMKSDLFRMIFDAFFGGEGPGQGLIRHMMLLMDPPDHTRLRTLANAAFSRRAVEEWRPEITRIVDELLDQIKQHDEVELMEAFAYPLPVTVIAELMGVPLEDRDNFSAWSRELIEMFSFSLETLGPETAERGTAAILKFRDYFTALADDRRANPRDDLLTAFVEVEQAGEKMSIEELLAMCMLLLIAGHETTANLIGNGTVALLRDPDALERMRDDPSVTSSGVEELLRYDSPVQMTARTTLEPIEIAGYEIPAAQRVATLLGSSNRDPAHFDRPDELVLDRTSSPHVSFGGGIHFCLGAPLARLEARIAFPRMLQALDLSFTGDLEWRKTFPFRGLRKLPVRVSAG